MDLGAQAKVRGRGQQVMRGAGDRTPLAAGAGCDAGCAHGPGLAQPAHVPAFALPAA
jgi:hypothetical protein